MISKEQLDKITTKLIWGVFRNDDIMWSDIPMAKVGDTEYDLRDIIATLHNYLYEAVTGKRYDYMFHWCNKIGSDCDDDVFSENYPKNNDVIPF